MKKKKSEKIYDDILKNSTSKGIRSIAEVKSICDALERECLPISMHNIKLVIKEDNVKIRYQSIINNKNISEYIMCRISESNILGLNFKISNKAREKIYLSELFQENLLLKEIIKKYNIIN